MGKSYFLQINGITLYFYAKFQQIWKAEDFGMNLVSKIYKRQILRKITHQNRNHHITMCPYKKFQSILRTLHFETKFAKKKMNDKILKKSILKSLISM